MIDDILKKYPNDVRIVVKQFPLSFHKQARKASLYALAADRQGKYKEMSDKIFENYRNLKSNEDLPRQYAQELGLDMVKFDKDMQDPALEARINKEMNQMKQSGIPRMSVPKFLINGKEPQGGRNLENFSAIIDVELTNKSGCKEDVCISIINHNRQNKTFDIYMINQKPVAGFQCDLAGINIIGADGGLLQKNQYQTSNSADRILSFNMQGILIPIGEGILTTISYSNPINEVCMTEIIFASNGGVKLTNNIPNCLK